MSISSPAIGSVCLYCGSSAGADPAYAQAAARFGTALAEAGVRLVYGGGGIGMMGACARAVVAGGGRVTGVIPQFLMLPEVAYDQAEQIVVPSMHERKAVMFREADAFAVLPGGIGTLEEVVELLSWLRLGLHRKPIVFLDLNGYWRPFFALVTHTVDEGFTPAWFAGAWRSVEGVDDLLPTMRAMLAEGEGQAPPDTSLALT